MNSILFQRGIYPGETFTSEQNYGITILMSTDPKIKDFLSNVLSQLEGDLYLSCNQNSFLHPLALNFRMAQEGPSRSSLDDYKESVHRRDNRMLGLQGTIGGCFERG